MPPRQSAERPPFRVGDTVRCVDNDGITSALAKGTIYQVYGIIWSSSFKCWYVAIAEGEDPGFDSSRFAKVESPAGKPLAISSEMDTAEIEVASAT